MSLAEYRPAHPPARPVVSRRPCAARLPRFVALLAAAILLALQGCGVPARLPAVPQADEAKAVVGGMSGIRYWQRDDLALMEKDALEAYEREAALYTATGHKGPLPPAEYLAISGGGENGAYGAGLLTGWTATGTRPEFKLVTGVSTGALTAPFAFLGPDYDDELKEVYTGLTAQDVLEKRNFLAAVYNDAMADNAPLRALIARHITPEMLAKIAAEHRKGRILLIGTTNLDARRPVIWNITKIAASGSPDALKLIRDILAASAAIPGAFPPTMIDVQIDGRRYQEMHVDGGASAQVFVYPPVLQIAKLSEQAKITRDRRLYLIRNARLDPDWADTRRVTLDIAGRAISSLIQTQGVGDLYRIYATAKRDGVDFNLAYIPDTFDVPLPEPFDQHYMRELFALGYERGRSGYSWEKMPPGY